MSVKRGTSNTNVRGSAEARRRRKNYLLVTFGDGITVQCSHCPEVLTFVTLTVDRIVPGARGGTYERRNIRPSCGPCNIRLGLRLQAWLRAERKLLAALEALEVAA